ncbi:RNA-directed DNA polymerase (reverse transcriptase)-related family protein [Rhynchospora pubera]|uniref:RNA-directed DNA polymerase (Reverse transcriptase)-related family protein n=1 Tax=Rhynchospora pubera TaxID=906938 RepID=A0AAV8FDN9_9POAL|nr:RNA-directed DNA polymerase (reverse transcriptase)-related family protein [Rhynchospora pubera]
MKRVIATLVSPNQTAFTPGRDISENIIVLREVMHSINSANYSTDSFCYKCDLSKAFDRMNWVFIFRVLAIYGFPGMYIEWIKACVTTARFSILFNGKADGFIEPKRGLRQGCALSPYLFILCMDVLSRMLDFYAGREYISGIRVARSAPKLTSIMFADDLVIFGEASVQQATRTQEILDIFCQMSGQRIGHDKSSVWFSRTTSQQLRQCIMRILNARPGEDLHIYLGVPVRASRPAHFDHLINKVQRKISTWTAKSLSQAGKVVLFRSVIEPLIVFSTAGGPLPSSVAAKIELMIRSFFWESAGKQKMHLISWDHITMPKNSGGLGLRKIEVLNKAMMLKILWKLACKECEGAPWVKLLRAKYLSTKCLWLSGQPRNCMKLWRSIMQNRELIKPFIKWQIGRGDKCRVYGEPWHDSWQAITPTSVRQRNLRLQDLTDNEGATWSHDSLANNLGVPVGLRITTIYPWPPMKNNMRPDRLLYTSNASGSFNFKEACKLVQGVAPTLSSRESSILKAIWHSPGLIPRVRLFLWKLVNNALPVTGTCASRLRKPVPLCEVCNLQPDLPPHALFQCPFAETFWFASPFCMRTQCLPFDVKELVFTVCQSLQGSMFVGFAYHLWALWKTRLTSNFTIPKPLRLVWQQNQRSAQEGFMCFVDGSFDLPNYGGWAYAMHTGDSLVEYKLGGGDAFSAFGTELQAMKMAIKGALLLNMNTVHNLAHGNRNPVPFIEN